MLHRPESRQLRPARENAYTWPRWARARSGISFYFDRLSAVMTLIVTGGRIAHSHLLDRLHSPGQELRAVFAYLNLFLFFMLAARAGQDAASSSRGGRAWARVLSPHRVLVRGHGEGTSGKKAFNRQRIGDAGFLLGMFVLVLHARHARNGPDQRGVLDEPAAAVSASLIGVLLFIGATGKSAADPALRVASRRHGRPDAGFRADPRSHHGDRRRVHDRPLAPIYMHAPEASDWSPLVGALTALFAATIAITQTDIKKVLAYLDRVAARLHVRRPRRRRLRRWAVFHVYTMRSSSVPLPRRGQRDPRALRRAGHPPMGGLAREDPDHVRHNSRSRPPPSPASRPSPASSRRTRSVVRLRERARRLDAALDGHVAHRADSAFYMFPCSADVLRPVADGSRSRASRPRVAAIHDLGAGDPAVLSAIGGFFSVPHFLEPQLPLPAVPDSLHHYESCSSGSRSPSARCLAVAAIRLRRTGARASAFFPASQACTGCSTTSTTWTSSTTPSSRNRFSGSRIACSCEW